VKSVEEALVRRAAAGDRDAFAPLVETYQKQVYNLALRMTGSPDDALDLSQETFLRAWRGLPSYRAGAAFSTWLYRLAANVCIDFLRHRRREKTVPLCAPDGEGGEAGLPSPVPDALAQTLARFEREQVARALSQLEPDYRIALTLRAVDGLSYAEIAAALDIPAGTVKSRIARAREKMRVLLQKNGNQSASPSSKRAKGGPT